MKNIHAYIFVHDQDIIDAYETTKKLEKTFGQNYTYVFLGQKEVKLSPKIIIARNLIYNIEHFPKLVTFTGWYALVKNGFINHENNILLEYDVILSAKFDKVVTETMKKSKKTGVFSFIPIPKDFLFYEYMDKFFEDIFVLDFKERREHFISEGGNEKWCGTSNTIWNKYDLVSFVNWFEGCLNNHNIDASYPGLGHVVERAITAWCIFTETKYKFITGVLEHYYLDSHETQSIHNGGVQKNYKDYIKELSYR